MLLCVHVLLSYVTVSRIFRTVESFTSLGSLNGIKRCNRFEIKAQKVEEINSKPEWMKCINTISPKTGSLNEIVSIVSDVSLERANYLISIGAVWAKMDILTEEELLDQYYTEDSALANLKYSDIDKSRYHTNQRSSTDEEVFNEFISRMESRRYQRIMSPSIIAQGTDLRIYPIPRRFQQASEIIQANPSKHLLHEDTTFIIVDKPPLLPTQPDASNYQESVPGIVGATYGPFESLTTGEVVERPFLCHRVDMCVAGCVVLSKDENGQRVFSQYQRERKVKKLYLAVTKNPVPIGMHIHWMFRAMTRRGAAGGPPCHLVSHQVPLNRKAAKKWIRCILEVNKCEPIKVQKTEFYDPGDDQHYQITIRLISGRKHQIRSQLASLGAPIINDSLYQSVSGMTLDMLNSEEYSETMDMALGKCRVPVQPIGLQAHAILFGGIRAMASTPWWVGE